jgi:hypothetical protein
VEILRITTIRLTLRHLAELEHAENLTDVILRWHGDPCLKEVFPVLERWRKLRRLTLDNYNNFQHKDFPPFEVFGSFIMGMNHLSYLRIPPCRSNYGQLKILSDRVNELILPERPNFKFDISYY